MSTVDVRGFVLWPAVAAAIALPPVATERQRPHEAQSVAQTRFEVAPLAAALPIDPPTAYAQYCSACHGEKAEGDGMAAVAFNPKPRDLSDPQFWSERTDAQVDSVIVRGTGVMPPLGQIMDSETRGALIAYLRELYGSGR